MRELADKDFKATIINIYKDLKETMLKKFVKNTMTMSNQIENINKETELIKTKKMELKNVITKNENFRGTEQQI